VTLFWPARRTLRRAARDVAAGAG